MATKKKTGKAAKAPAKKRKPAARKAAAKRPAARKAAARKSPAVRKLTAVAKRTGRGLRKHPAPGRGKTTPTATLVAKHGQTAEEKAIYRDKYLPVKKAASRALFKGDKGAAKQAISILSRV